MPYNFQRTSPRDVVLAWIAIWVLVTAPMLAVGIDGFYENHRFAMNSAHTQGWVEEAYQTTTAGKSGMHTRRTLSYSYTVGVVTYSSGVKMVAGSTGQQYQAHDPIPVIYLRDEPSDSRPDLPAEAWIYQVVPIGLAVICGLTLAGGISMMVKSRSGRRGRPGAGGNPSSRA